MSYAVEERYLCWCVVTPPKSAHPNWKLTVASCPTQEAAEAARRLLSGECERELASARMLARVVAAKEPEPPVCGVCNDTRTRTDGHMCTACPVPCNKCQAGAYPFCRETRCDCECHAQNPASFPRVVEKTYARYARVVSAQESLDLAAAFTRVVSDVHAMQAQQTEDYERGKADGAAQERARIVGLLRERNEWEAPGDLADRIERGEAGE